MRGCLPKTVGFTLFLLCTLWCNKGLRLIIVVGDPPYHDHPLVLSHNQLVPVSLSRPAEMLEPTSVFAASRFSRRVLAKDETELIVKILSITSNLQKFTSSTCQV
jgi:hypothetical protein